MEAVSYHPTLPPEPLDLHAQGTVVSRLDIKLHIPTSKMDNLRLPLHEAGMPPNPSFSTNHSINARMTVSALLAWPWTQKVGCSSPLIKLVRFSW
jgi:hypothetical protein